MPGTPLGTFNVTGTLTTNTCGAGQNAPEPVDVSGRSVARRFDALLELEGRQRLPYPGLS